MRWLDDVSMDLRKMGVKEQRDRARNWEAWLHIGEEAKAHHGLQRHLEEEDICVFISVGLNIKRYEDEMTITDPIKTNTSKK